MACGGYYGMWCTMGYDGYCGVWWLLLWVVVTIGCGGYYGVWCFQQTREELREALESEIRSFTVDKVRSLIACDATHLSCGLVNY